MLLPAWVVPSVLSAVSTLLLLGGQHLADQLRYDRAAVAHGAWWLLLSGNLVHLGFWHLFLNVLSLVLLVLLCPEPLPLAEWLGRVLVIGTGMSLGLYWLSPGVQTYVGLSGLIYGLFAIGLGQQAVRGDRIAIAALVFLAGRIGFELQYGATPGETRLIGGGIVAESHLWGACSAILYGGATWLLHTIRTTR